MLRSMQDRLRSSDDLRALIADSRDEDLIDRLTERIKDVLHLYGVACDALPVPLCVFKTCRLIRVERRRGTAACFVMSSDDLLCLLLGLWTADRINEAVGESREQKGI